MRRRLILATAVSAGSLLLGTPAIAGAAPAAKPKAVVVSSSVVAPFQLAYRNGALYIADGAGVIYRLKGKTQQFVTRGQITSLEGVAINAQGTLAYTSGHGTGEMVTATTLTILAKGKKPVIANLLAFEKRHDPDAKVQYGISHPSACVKAAFKKIHTPASYPGAQDLESNAYAVAALPGGSWAVADAGGNDLLRVSPTGKVSLIGVLPSTPLKFTAAVAKEQKLAKCVVGKTYKFEAVPTDVEVGPAGSFYVSTLPGGIEAPIGSVYKVSAKGVTTRIATGFDGATNLAVSPRGVVYVAEQYSGTIARAAHGHAVTVAKLPNVLSLVWGGGALYAGTSAPGLFTTGKPTGPGTIVKITL